MNTTWKEKKLEVNDVIKRIAEGEGRSIQEVAVRIVSRIEKEKQDE